MNILVCINSKFKYYLLVMLNSLSRNNPYENLNVFVLHSDLTEEDIKYLETNNSNTLLKFIFIKVDEKGLEKAPTVKKYPKEIYYRIFAYKYLPKSINRILYLDVDIVVIKNIATFYNTSFDDNYFVASTHNSGLMNLCNSLRLGVKRGNVYLNSGVMLINIELLRNNVNENEIYKFIIKNKNNMILFDQDVIFGLWGDKIKVVDHLIYNLSDRHISINNRRHPFNKIDKNWVEDNCYIIHYIGKNKPWNDNYKGILLDYYNKYTV